MVNIETNRNLSSNSSCEWKKRTTTLVEMYLYVARLIAAEANSCSITDFAQHSFTNRTLLVNYCQFLPVASGDGRFVIYVNITMILGNKTWSWRLRFLRGLCRPRSLPTVYPMKHKCHVHHVRNLTTSQPRRDLSATALHRKDTGYRFRMDKKSLFEEMLHLIKYTCDEYSIECAEEEMDLRQRKDNRGLINPLKDPRRSGREKNPPTFYHDVYTGIRTAKYSALYLPEIEKLIKAFP